MDTERLKNNLRLLRTANRLSQEALSEQICLARTTYLAYERGAKIPDLQTLDALAAMYNIGLESLMSNDLSTELMGSIYFDDENKALAELLCNFESLSTSSKKIITERLSTLLEMENNLHDGFCSPDKPDRNEPR